MKLLLSSDLHIGRSSSSVPDTVPREDTRATASWSRMVDLAIEEKVGVVCLAGDVADQENKFWEAIGPLQRGIHRLAEANIRTVAVSGNHDYDVLVRLADQLPPEHFTLLGRGGRWERLTIDRTGHPLLHIDGWSFPNQQVYHSPLASYDLHHDPTTPTLGIVHGDLDSATTPYAPLDVARLRAMGPGGWLLGHVHAPRLIDGPPWILYPGSPQALDPGETGPHGPWLVEVNESMLGAPAQRPLSTIWYGPHQVDMSSVTTEPEFESALVSEIRAQAERIADQAGSELAHASLRLRLVGSTPLCSRVPELAQRVTEDLSLPAGNGSLTVESVDVQTMPAIDLGEFAKTNSPPGALARLLLELDRTEMSPEVSELIRQARDALRRNADKKEFAQLNRAEVTEQMALEHVRTQSRAFLTQLVTQNP